MWTECFKSRGPWCWRVLFPVTHSQWYMSKLTGNVCLMHGAPGKELKLRNQSSIALCTRATPNPDHVVTVTLGQTDYSTQDHGYITSSIWLERRGRLGKPHTFLLWRRCSGLLVLEAGDYLFWTAGRAVDTVRAVGDKSCSRENLRAFNMHQGLCTKAGISALAFIKITPGILRKYIYLKSHPSTIKSESLERKLKENREGSIFWWDPSSFILSFDQ